MTRAHDVTHFLIIAALRLVDLTANITPFALPSTTLTAILTDESKLMQVQTAE